MVRLEEIRPALKGHHLVWAGVIAGLICLATITAFYAVVLFYLLVADALGVSAAPGGGLSERISIAISWTVRVLFGIFVGYGAVVIGRRVVAPEVNGVLLGVASAVLVQLVFAFRSPPFRWSEGAMYLLIGIVCGALGGYEGRNIRGTSRAVHRAITGIGRATHSDDVLAIVARELGEQDDGGSFCAHAIYEPEGDSANAKSASPVGAGEHVTPEAADVKIWPPGAVPEGFVHSILSETQTREGTPSASGTESTLKLVLVKRLPADLRTELTKHCVRTVVIGEVRRQPELPTRVFLLSLGARRRMRRQSRRNYMAVFEHASTAVERLESESEARERQVQVAALEAIVSERQRMSREMHDSSMQKFNGVLTSLQAAVAGLGSPQGPEPPAIKYIREARDAAREGVRELRRVVWDLRPEALEDRTLAGAIERLISTWSSLHDIDVAMSVDGTPRGVTARQEAALYRIAEGALGNVATHSQAGRVTVTLSFLDDVVALDIIDDGKGFSPDEVGEIGPRGGTGIISMRERLHELGGELDITRCPGKGTEVSAKIPLLAPGEPWGEPEGLTRSGGE